MRSGTAASFTLERYRTQWSHLPLVTLPFLLVVGAVLALFALEPFLGETLGSGILSAMGIAFAAFVLALPRLWRAWRARGRAALRLADGALSLVDPDSGRALGSCPASGSHVAPAEFRYTVNARFAGGAYRAPALVLDLGGGGRVAIGAAGSRFAWRGDLEHVVRPDYAMDPAEWETLVGMLGMEDLLVAIPDVRIAAE